jgi:two-component system, NarL family, sensor histidine kinase EvgS
MKPRHGLRPWWARYGVAVALVALAADLRIWPLQTLESSLVWLTFYPAVMVVAVWGGLSAGLLATALAGLVAVFLWPVLVAKPFIDGSAGWLGMAVFTLTGGMISGVAEAMRRAQARAVKAQQEAEQSNRAKDSFLATMSHEIRTPLNGLLGMLELLSLTSLDREQEETLKVAWDSGRSLLRIVNDILEWSKIEEGKLQLSPHPTSIPLLLQDVVNTYSRVASAKALVLRQQADARLGTAHVVDALRLSQILNNFVSNAIKFTRQGGIEVSAELLDQHDGRERIRFSVKDTGIGISKEVQRHLFQRYRQGSVDTTRMYGGTGLGLAICRRLAELMDGNIGLESEPGQGATFSLTLTLPVSASPGEPSQRLYPEVEQRTVTPLWGSSVEAPLVLVVDDNPTNRDLMSRQIRQLGLRAITAENGQEALPTWRTGRIGAVVTDCHMPLMDGYALARAIRTVESEDARPRTPIIAWTANALPEEAGKCHAAGMDDTLVKPVGMTQLRGTLARWLYIEGTDGSQPTPARGQSDGERHAAPLDGDLLQNILPDSAERAQVLLEFGVHLRNDRATLLEVLKRGDQASVEQTAHRMKGSSSMVGAKDLATACAAIEHAARDGDLASARAAEAALDEAIMRLETHLSMALGPGTGST